VADIVAAMAAVTDKPVTVKHRVGIQGFGFHRESFEELAEFVRIVAEAGCDRFIVHARIAMLEGLTPRENRSVPPIRYEDAYRLKALWPNLHVELNGQIKTLDDCRTHLSHGMDGLMIGRASYEHPLLMAGLDAFEADWLAGRMGEGGAGRAEEAIGGLAAEGGDRAFRCNSSPDSPPADHPAPGFPLQSLARSGAGAVPELDRRALVLLWADYMDRWKERGLNPRSLVWPILELFPGVPGSRKYRQILSQPYLKEVSVAALARQALAELPGDVR
jgi:tRNA-dihydrouridine synthase A